MAASLPLPHRKTTQTSNQQPCLTTGRSFVYSTHRHFTIRCRWKHLQESRLLRSKKKFVLQVFKIIIRLASQTTTKIKERLQRKKKKNVNIQRIDKRKRRKNRKPRTSRKSPSRNPSQPNLLIHPPPNPRLTQANYHPFLSNQSQLGGDPVFIGRKTLVQLSSIRRVPDVFHSDAARRNIVSSYRQLIFFFRFFFLFGLLFSPKG